MYRCKVHVVLYIGYTHARIVTCLLITVEVGTIDSEVEHAIVPVRHVYNYNHCTCITIIVLHINTVNAVQIYIIIHQWVK